MCEVCACQHFQVPTRWWGMELCASFKVYSTLGCADLNSLFTFKVLIKSSKNKVNHFWPSPCSWQLAGAPQHVHSHVRVCVRVRACLSQDCIYSHPAPSEAGPEADGADSVVCLAFLSGDCRFGTRCRNRHPSSPLEVQKLLDKYARTPCR